MSGKWASQSLFLSMIRFPDGTCVEGLIVGDLFGIVWTSTIVCPDCGFVAEYWLCLCGTSLIIAHPCCNIQGRIIGILDGHNHTNNKTWHLVSKKYNILSYICIVFIIILYKLALDCYLTWSLLGWCIRRCYHTISILTISTQDCTRTLNWAVFRCW